MVLDSVISIMSIHIKYILKILTNQTIWISLSFTRQDLSEGLQVTESVKVLIIIPFSNRELASDDIFNYFHINIFSSW